MICIYHGPDCADGFTAAWVVQKRYPDATFIPAKYGDLPPDVCGQDVIIVDFSFAYDVMRRLAEESRTLRVFDHHATAKEPLERLARTGWANVTYDGLRSGAGLAWDALFPGKPRPKLVDYVEDRDLWRWALPHSKEINACVGVTARTFREWDDMAMAFELNLGAVAQSGLTLLEQVKRYVEAMRPLARKVVFHGHLIPVVNAPPTHISELLHALAEQSGTYALGWYQDGEGTYRYSLRSIGDDWDVAVLAKHYGGGGHKNAAGFESKERVDR